MLIIQIALGIVLAFVLLAFLPQILSLGFLLVIVAFAIATFALLAHLFSDYLNYLGDTFTEYLSHLGSILAFMWCALAIYALIKTAINWKSTDRKEKIDELKTEINNLNLILQISENSNGDVKDLKNKSQSLQNLREKIKTKEEQLRKLLVETTKSSVGTQ